VIPTLGVVALAASCGTGSLALLAGVGLPSTREPRTFKLCNYYCWTRSTRQAWAADACTGDKLSAEQQIDPRRQVAFLEEANIRLRQHCGSAVSSWPSTRPGCLQMRLSKCKFRHGIRPENAGPALGLEPCPLLASAPALRYCARPAPGLAVPADFHQACASQVAAGRWPHYVGNQRRTPALSAVRLGLHWPLASRPHCPLVGTRLSLLLPSENHANCRMLRRATEPVSSALMVVTILLLKNGITHLGVPHRLMTPAADTARMSTRKPAWHKDKRHVSQFET
jgi:hypothetical protein